LLEKAHPKVYEYRFKETFVKRAVEYFVNRKGGHVNKILFQDGDSEDTNF